MARRPSSRPGLRLVAVAVVLLAMYSTMIGTGHTSPKLGLDLEGGTSVTLTPKQVGSAKITSGQLATAVSIIRQRVNGLGVSESTVVKQGNDVVISVPGKGRSSVLTSVGETAQLSFRELYTQAQTNVPPGSAAKPLVTPTATTSGSASPAPSASAGHPMVSPGAKVSPRATASAGAAASGSPAAAARPSTSSAGRALSGALTGAAVSPTPSPSAKASTSAKASSTATPVLSQGAGAPTPNPRATGGAATTGGTEANQTAPTAAELAMFQALDCGKNGGRPQNVDPDPHHYVVACDRTLPFKYLLTPADLLGTDVSTAQATIPQTSTGASTGEWAVELVFKDKAVSKVQSVSSRLFAANMAPLAITLDGVVVSAPSTNGDLGKNVEITGSQASPFTHTQAGDLANQLKYGSLPVQFDQGDVVSVSATLGKSSLRAGLLAGALGLLLVLIYVFIYYRALGLVTVASLAVSGAMVFGSVVLLGQAIGFTLTLAGIAGLIVSVGITADSFVVFFERLKDEIREGRSPRQAVEYGWVRARRTILSADTISFLAAVILYYVSIGDVRGFAFTLGLSTVLDLVTVFLFTKPLVTLLIRYPSFSTKPISGLSAERTGARTATPREA